MTEAPVASRSLNYRADIDGMRAVAVLLVLAFHFDLAPHGNAGFIGVDVFFVISGFLITSIIRHQLEDGRFRIGAFYVNRIRRLAPALLAVLLLVVAAGSLTLFPDDLIELAKQTLSAQLYLANIYYWRTVSYFGLSSDRVFLLHTWSLAVEEQFYVFYPLAIVCIHRYGRRYFWTVLTVAALASFALNIALVERKPEATFYLLPTRAWELLIGGLVPPLGARWSRSRSVDEVIGLLGLALLFAAVFGYSEEFHFPGWFALLPVMGTACLLLSGTGTSTLTARMLGIPAIAYVGKISYSLYLVHWPLNVFARRAWGEDFTLSRRLAMFTASLVIAAFLYHFVENPFRHRRLLANNKRLLWAYGAGVAATLLAFVVIEQTRGLPERFPDDVIRIASFANDQSPALRECEFSDADPSAAKGYCRIGAPTGTPQWFVFGDSHAWATHAAFDEWLKQKNQSGLFAFLHACPPLNGVHLFNDRGRCFAFNHAVTAYLDAHPEITNVVLVSTWRQGAEDALTTAPDKLLSKLDARQLFQQKFAETLTHLHDGGRRVFVWEPLPGAKKNVPVSLATAAWKHQPAAIEFTRDRYREENAFFFSALEKNRHLIAMSFSPSDALCESGVCAVSIDGDPVYFDSTHPTHSSAAFWVRMLQRTERAAANADPPKEPR